MKILIKYNHTIIERLKLLSHEDDVKVLYEGKTQNHLIMVCPTLEEWILKAAKEARVDVGSYGLPYDAHDLHRTITIRLKNFENLVGDMRGRSRMLKTLERFVKDK